MEENDQPARLAESGEMMRILGLSCHYHDAAAALVQDDEIVFAVQEERLSRDKHDAAFPVRAIAKALEYGRTRMDGIDAVAFYEQPGVKFRRLFTQALLDWPQGLSFFTQALPSFLQHKEDVVGQIRAHLGYKGPVQCVEHHASHAASAFFTSPFERALVLTVDGVGEYDTTAIFLGEGNRLKKLKSISFPHSLGLLYSVITAFLGFEVNEGEYKVMGLAPYGTPRFLDKIIGPILRLHDDGSYSLNPKFFCFTGTDRHFTSALAAHLGVPPRLRGGPMTRAYEDVAASMQRALELALSHILAPLIRETGITDVCMAGGVALNCTANAALIRAHGIRLHIHPAAGDAGGALGAALLLAARQKQDAPVYRPSFSPYIGTEATPALCAYTLQQNRIAYRTCEDIADAVAEKLEAGQVVALCTGREEWGPRALGARSILADPRRADMKEHLNAKIKFREEFRPFAPVVMEEHYGAYFEELGMACAPYMLFTHKVKKPEVIPAVTHVDGTARAQTISAAQNPYYYAILQAFYRRTGVPVLINTSFNLKGEPMVSSPSDALKTFYNSGIDALVLGNLLVEKSA